MSTDSVASHPWRKIRSFVLRPGRLTKAQEAALSVLLPEYSFNPQVQPSADRMVLEIGFGNGQALAHMAKTDPTSHIIGVEVHPPGVGRLLNALHAQQIANVSIAMQDAVELLEHDIPNAYLDEVRIYFPDPWPKKKHHKRRIIQSEFVHLMHQRLKLGGRLHLATDWMPYAEWMQEVVSAHGGFEYQPSATHQRPETHFQRRGERRGHSIVDLIYVRTEAPKGSNADGCSKLEVS